VRNKPYTEAGIPRVPCQRCGKPSKHQWQICATGNQWSGVCVECDIALNKLVLEFMGLPKYLGSIYAATQRTLHNPRNSKKSKTSRGLDLTQKEIRE